MAEAAGLTVRPPGVADVTHHPIGTPGAAAPFENRAAEIQLDRVEARASWLNRYRRRLVLADTIALLLASVLSVVLRFGDISDRPARWSYVAGALVIMILWMALLSASGAYDVRHLGLGLEEAKRVARASAGALGLVAATFYLVSFDLARGYVAIVIPVGIALVAGGRMLVRADVYRNRRAGRWTQRTLACGTEEAVNALIDATSRRRRAGIRVVGACLADSERGIRLHRDVPVVGDLGSIVGAAAVIDADVVALGATGLPTSRIRQIGWALEGTGRAMALAPGLTDVAGPRMRVSPIEGLPLVWVEQPQFTGCARAAKRAADVVLTLFLLVILSPVLLAVSVLVKASSSGPVIYRQSRLGQHGGEFMVFKFRSMYRDAEASRRDYLAQNENDGALFKMRLDPRVTPIGRVIRRLSIDELPQLVNVLRGDMSLVGPRPLATEDSTLR